MARVRAGKGRAFERSQRILRVRGFHLGRVSHSDMGSSALQIRTGVLLHGTARYRTVGSRALPFFARVARRGVPRFHRLSVNARSQSVDHRTMQHCRAGVVR